MFRIVQAQGIIPRSIASIGRIGQRRGIFGIITKRVGVRVGVIAFGSIFGGGAYVAQSYLDFINKFPDAAYLKNVRDNVFDRLQELQDWLKLQSKERKQAETGMEEEMTEDELKSAVKSLAEKALKNPLHSAVPPEITERMPVYFSDTRLLFITKQLLNLKDTLSSIHDVDWKLPVIVVIGSQSSGKSSVLEGIVGHEFLPKGKNMVTRRPLELTLVNTPDSDVEYGEFPQLKITNLTDFKKIRDYIQQLNESVGEGVSSEPIQLRIYSKHLPSLSLIDLPGYITVTSDKQNADLKDKIAELCEKYIQAPNIILAVSAAEVDLANSDSIAASRRVDPEGKRTLGILTKMDLLRPEEGVEKLLQTNSALVKQNKQKEPSYHLDLGYVGVVNKIPAKGQLFEDADLFFKNHSIYSEVEDRVGIVNLRIKLLKILEEHMVKSLNALTDQVKSELDETMYQLKVEYDDRRISPLHFFQSLAATVKQNFRRSTDQFSKEKIRLLMEEKFDEKLIEVLDKVYWDKFNATKSEPNSRPPMSNRKQINIDDAKNGSRTNSNDLNIKSGQTKNNNTVKSSKIDFTLIGVDAKLRKKLEQAIEILTTMRLGRLATNSFTDQIRKQVDLFVANDIFNLQPAIKQKVASLTNQILDEREEPTAEIIESNLKWFKTNVDFSQEDWERAYWKSLEILKKELGLSQKKLDAYYSKYGKRQVDKTIQTLQSQKEKGNIESTKTDLPLEVAEESLKLKSKVDIIRLRLGYIQKNGKKFGPAKYTCPEVYLAALVHQMSNSCATTIKIEMWDEFSYQFPLLVDQQLYYSLPSPEKSQFIKNDPLIQRHIDLQNKKDELDNAYSEMVKLVQYLQLVS